MKLDQFLTSQTSTSRRKVLELLKAGHITVNGKVADAMTHPVDPKSDTVQIQGKTVTYTATFFYFKFHKPRGVISTLSDPKNRKNLRDFYKDIPSSVIPIGRLDRNSEGLLLFTNDGELANKVAHPSFKLPKTYQVILDKPLKSTDIDRLEYGIFLDDGPVKFDECTPDLPYITVTISEGRNRIIRRAFEHLGYTVKKLVRISVGPITLNQLKAGQFKRLTPNELTDLKNNLISNQSIDN